MISILLWFLRGCIYGCTHNLLEHVNLRKRRESLSSIKVSTMAFLKPFTSQKILKGKTLGYLLILMRLLCDHLEALALAYLHTLVRLR